MKRTALPATGQISLQAT